MVRGGGLGNKLQNLRGIAMIEEEEGIQSNLIEIIFTWYHHGGWVEGGGRCTIQIGMGQQKSDYWRIFFGNKIQCASCKSILYAVFPGPICRLLVFSS